MIKNVSSWLAITLTLVTVFGGCPPNKHGTIVSYAQDNVATSSNAEYTDEIEKEPIKIATPSQAEKEEHVHIKENAEKIDISDLSNVSILDKAEELDVKVADNVAVRIPVRVSLDGYSTETQFEVEVIGTMGDDSVLSIVPDPNFELKSLHKKDIAGHVELEQEEIFKADLEENGRTAINGKITLDRMVTAGKWDGNFNISVCLLSPELEDVDWEYLQSMEEIEEPEIATNSNAKPVLDNDKEKPTGEVNTDSSENSNETSEENKNDIENNEEVSVDSSDTSNENNSSSEESENTPVEDTEIKEEPEENQETPEESTETSENESGGLENEEESSESSDSSNISNGETESSESETDTEISEDSSEENSGESSEESSTVDNAEESIETYISTSESGSEENSDTVENDSLSDTSNDNTSSDGKDTSTSNNESNNESEEKLTC